MSLQMKTKLKVDDNFNIGRMCDILSQQPLLDKMKYLIVLVTRYTSKGDLTAIKITDDFSLNVLSKALLRKKTNTKKKKKLISE